MNSNEKIFTTFERVSPTQGLPFEDYVKKLKKLISSKVEAAYVFGSYAQGTQNRDSDLDLILVIKTQIPFFERYKLVPEVFEITDHFDLLIYTPEEFEKLKSDKTSGFWRDVSKTMKKIV